MHHQILVKHLVKFSALWLISNNLVVKIIVFTERFGLDKLLF